MATHAMAATDIARHEFTLTPNEVEVITFGRDVGAVEIISNGAAKAYYTTDGSTPVVRGPRTRVLPDTLTVDERDLSGMGNDSIRFISEGAPTLHVQLA